MPFLIKKSKYNQKVSFDVILNDIFLLYLFFFFFYEKWPAFPIPVYRLSSN
jgi:hypothetical protein